MRWILEHPVISVIFGLIGAGVGVLSLVEPVYSVSSDGERCGYGLKETTSRPYEFKACTHPNHGIERYQYSETVSGSSGWRGGGYNPQAWCNDVKRAKERAVQQPLVWGNAQPREERKKDWKGRAEYNYHCTIQVQWGPVYRTARSAACGEATPVIRKESVPLECEDKSRRISWKWKWE